MVYDDYKAKNQSQESKAKSKDKRWRDSKINFKPYTLKLSHT